MHGTARSTPQLHHCLVLLSGEVQSAKEAVLDVIEKVAVHCEGRSFALKLKTNESS